MGRSVRIHTRTIRNTAASSSPSNVTVAPTYTESGLIKEFDAVHSRRRTDGASAALELLDRRALAVHRGAPAAIIRVAGHHQSGAGELRLEDGSAGRAADDAKPVGSRRTARSR